MIKKLIDHDTITSTKPAFTPPALAPTTDRSTDRSTKATVGQDTSVIETRLEQLEHLQHELDDGQPGDLTTSATATTRLSIVVPVYNEVATIRTVLNKLLDLDVKLDKEVIVVDDGSTDGTGEILARLQSTPGLRVVLTPHNRGKGAALRTGFQHVTGDIVLVQDADLEYDPNDIPRLIEPILEGDADVVYGSRFLERRHRNSSYFHQLGNRLLTMASNWMTGLRLTDMETCYKVFRAEELQKFEIQQDRFGFEPEVTAKLAKLGLHFVELPVRYDARDWDAGKKIGWRDAISAFYCIVRYRFVS